MQNTRIKSMRPYLDSEGTLQKKVTVNKPKRSKQIRVHWERVERRGKVEYIRKESAPKEIYIQKPLYTVEDENGTVRHMTKTQAKGVFSGRQVRKAMGRFRQAVSE